MFHKVAMLCWHFAELCFQIMRGGRVGQRAEVEGGVAHDTLCFGLQTVPNCKPSSRGNKIKKVAYCPFKCSVTRSISDMFEDCGLKNAFPAMQTFLKILLPFHICQSAMNVLLIVCLLNVCK